MTLKKISLTIAAATGLWAFAGTGLVAQEREFRGPGDRAAQSTLRILDLDGDGQVSSGEISDEQIRMIAAIDVNGDGVLSVDEFRRNGRLLIALNVTTFFDMMDVNGDRQLDEAEIVQPAQRWVARYDANADGVLDVDEIVAARLGIGN